MAKKTNTILPKCLGVRYRNHRLSRCLKLRDAGSGACTKDACNAQWKSVDDRWRTNFLESMEDANQHGCPLSRHVATKYARKIHAKLMARMQAKKQKWEDEDDLISQNALSTVLSNNDDEKEVNKHELPKNVNEDEALEVKDNSEEPPQYEDVVYAPTHFVPIINPTAEVHALEWLPHAWEKETDVGMD